jgi:hypothetical protein
LPRRIGIEDAGDAWPQNADHQRNTIYARGETSIDKITDAISHPNKGFLKQYNNPTLQEYNALSDSAHP